MKYTVIFLVTLSMFINGLACAQKSEPSEAKQNLRKVIPAYADKVEKAVAPLEKETPAESVSNLYYVNDYFSTGQEMEYITPDNVDQEDLYQIMSSRRFRKVLVELGKMDKTAASQLVKTNLMLALQGYLPWYERYLQGYSPLYKIGSTNTHVHVPFQVGSTRPGHEGEVTLMGEKLKVFSLVWISGMLRLENNKEQVEDVVRLALKQKKELDDDPTLMLNFKFRMMHGAGLYNRQILSSALIGVSFKDAGMESDVMTKAGIQWQQRTLVPYDAALTEFDKPVLSAMMRPDNSQGSITVNYVLPMKDTNFDLLLQEIHFK